MKITKNSTFPLISRPVRKCCSSTRNIDGFGSKFRTLEQKVLFLMIFMKIRTFLTFGLKSALFSLFRSKVGFRPKSRLWAPKCDLGAPGAPGGVPGRHPTGAPRGRVSGLGPSVVADPSALASASPLSISFSLSRCHSSCHSATRLQNQTCAAPQPALRLTSQTRPAPLSVSLSRRHYQRRHLAEACGTIATSNSFTRNAI